jgi:hypothetical protein
MKDECHCEEHRERNAVKSNDTVLSDSRSMQSPNREMEIASSRSFDSAAQNAAPLRTLLATKNLRR